MSWLGGWLQNSIGEWLGTGEPSAPGAMAAQITCSGAVIATLSVSESQPVIIEVAATLSGSSSFSCAATVIDNNPVYVVIGGGGSVYKPQRKRNRTADLTASLVGISPLTATSYGTAGISLQADGVGTLTASPLIGFNFKKHRQRKEEQSLTAWLLAA